MKSRFTFFLLILSFACSAQVSPPWAWAKSVPQVAETQRMFGLAADAEGNAIVVGQIMEARSPYENGMVVSKYSPDGSRLWATGFPGVLYNGATYMSAVCDADLNVYAVFDYTSGTIEVDGVPIEDSDLAMVKLDKDGNVLWAKAIGSSGNDELIEIQVVDNEVVVSAFGGGTFDRGTFNYNFPLWGLNYMTSYNFEGDLLQFGVLDQSTNNTLKKIYKEGADYIGYACEKTVKKQKLNTVTLEPETVATLDLVNEIGGYQLIVTDVVATPSGRLFVSGLFKSNYVLLEGDTIFNSNSGYPTCFIIETDQSMSVQNYITYYDVWGLQNQETIQQLAVYGDEKIAVQNWFYSKIIFPDDSLINEDGVKFAAITELNLDLTVRSMSQLKAWDANGWVSSGIEYDGGGNIYGLFRHEEDIYFDSILVSSYNKSWEHLSALGRLNSGALLSAGEAHLEKHTYRLFPNPVADELTIAGRQGQLQLSFTDMSGKVVYSISEVSNQSICVSHLPAGIYIVEIMDDKESKSFERLVKH